VWRQARIAGPSRPVPKGSQADEMGNARYDGGCLRTVHMHADPGPGHLRKP